jgi:hypothetical protein
VRGPIVRTAVRLDLDDPTLAPAGLVVANEARAEQDARGVRGRSREVRPVEEDPQATLPG